MSAPDTKTKAPSAGDYRITASSGWANAWKIAAGVGALGLAGAGAGWSMDPKRFAFSYLFAFIFGLTISFGAMFFVLVERLTAASWSVSTRRTAEFFAAGVPVFALLFLPVLASMTTLYPWLDGKADPVMEATAQAQEEQHAPPAGHPAVGQGHMGGAPGHMTPGAEPAHGHMPGQMPGAATEASASSAANDEAVEIADKDALESKSAWLNKTGWLVRAVIYFIAWSWIGLTFFRLSTSQDGTKDPKLTLRAQGLAPVATILFGFTLTGAVLDWLMSLLPTWYSTIYGVTIFAGSVVTIYATLILVTLSLREAGLLKSAVNVEHYHDMGKLLFGFLIFWAYTSFAQFMLIWYASIPDETTFFHHRWDVGPWLEVSLAIVVLHFVVPFFILLSRNVKRRTWALRIGATWLIVMHLVEMYWQVMPYYGGGEVSLHWMDLACLVGVVGIYLAVVFYRMTKHPLIPIGDPRLSRSLSFENG